VDFPKVGHDIGVYELATTWAIITQTPIPGSIAAPGTPGDGYERRDIDYGAFYGCTALREVIIPEAKVIGIAAFKDCRSLQSVNMENVWWIQQQGFEGCTRLTQVTLLHATKISGRAFKNCTNLTMVRLPERLTLDPRDLDAVQKLPKGDCGNNGNGSGGIKDVAYKNSIVIFDGVFDGCRALGTIEIPNAWNVHFGTHAFQNTGRTLDICLSDQNHSLNDGLCFGYSTLGPYDNETYTTITLDTVNFYGVDKCFENIKKNLIDGGMPTKIKLVKK